MADAINKSPPVKEVVADSPADISIIGTPAPLTEEQKLFLVEHYRHWWREPLAGTIAVGIATYDIWHYGRDAGFTSSLDEILLLTGIALIAGVRNLFPQSRSTISIK